MSDEMVEIFHEELRELLESLERGLIDLQVSPDDEGLVNQVFRDLHTIKGSGAMFGFVDLAAFIHDFETAFDKVRSGQVKVTNELIKLGLAARDEIPGLVEGTDDPDGVREEILAALTAMTADAGDAPPAPAVEEPLDVDFGDPLPEPEPVTAGAILRFTLTDDALGLGAIPSVVLGELRDLGGTDLKADISRVPGLSDLDVDVCYVGWSMYFPDGISREDIDEVFMFAEADWSLEADAPAEGGFDLDLGELAAEHENEEGVGFFAPDEVEEDEAEDAPVAEAPKPALAPAAPKPAAKAPKADASSEPAASVRVPAARLDTLMDSVGELVTVEARLTELARQSRDAAIIATAEEVARLAARLRDATMTMRMVPMRTLVARCRRLIMGLSDDLNKPVDFEVHGEETELDKTVIEKLADPLVHILRNAIDHGMETQEQRETTGKPMIGKVELSAVHAGGEVLIRVKDDGRGMNPDVIRHKAIERGLINSDMVLTDSQIFMLIFEPGFSTAETVTELSGRGVGMDVVRRTIEGLRGNIEVASKLGEGTTVTLRLPLTLAIIDGLLIEVDDERYTLPMAAVKEIFELPAEKTLASRTGDYLDIRGHFVPFIRLRSIFECTGEAPKEQNVVVVEAGESRIGIVVDHIIGTNQTVIKQVSKLQHSARSISGATILGDGTVSLIIDVPQLLAQAGPLADSSKEAAA
ncbi:chemotaxis protein CheA [Marivivens aquimaris]|uniref:chemotaxis protein CheA n=1 Tax=Marivivens aquimaris TaxID=2774876 RepID=UPI001D16EF7E|nr:chemotaxis protein CheA [Marivivens aquimaris]